RSRGTKEVTDHATHLGSRTLGLGDARDRGGARLVVPPGGVPTAGRRAGRARPERETAPGRSEDAGARDDGDLRGGARMNGLHRTEWRAVGTTCAAAVTADA